MELQDIDLRAILCFSHSLYWLLIVNAATLRRGNRRQKEKSIDTTATNQVSVSNAVLTQVLTGLTHSLYYILLAVWWFYPNLAGPALLPISSLLNLTGIAVLIAALVIKVWGFWVFRTWRLYPHIDPGHQLVTSGPYAWVRHPLYLGGQLLYLGSFLLVPQTGFFVQFLLNLFAYDFRIRVEEQLLTKAFGSAYQNYQQKTSRLLPWVY